MKIMYINAVPYGSTGKIMFSLSETVRAKGGDTVCATGFSWHKPNRPEHITVGNIWTKTFHMYMSRAFGNHGCYSALPTDRLIAKIKAFRPDVVHLHNIHGWYLHLPKLLDYLKKSNISVVWTLHDCWAFTGGCAHFTLCGCDGWLTGCGNCKNLSAYPIAGKTDKTKKMWKLKKDRLCGFRDLTVVTPSRWLSDLVKQSFLKEHPSAVINNGIDLSVFRPGESHFREKYKLQDKKIILGVAMGWSFAKGIDVFIHLANALSQDYQIVLVGTDDRIDKSLPKNIISVHRTQNQQELAEIYSAADLFVNPTREENYPTVNMEALACGTPVLTFRTGGSPEMLDETCGSVVACDDVTALEKEIVRICTQKPYSREACNEKAKVFDQKDRFNEYLKLYENIITERNQGN